MEKNKLRHIPIKFRQSGVSLFVVLIGLLVFSLAAVAIIRSVDTSTLIVGNLAFKNAATSTADQSVERAIVWLQNNNAGTVLFDDVAESSYYATSLDNLDVTGKSALTSKVAIGWTSSNCNACTGTTCSRCVVPSPEVTENGYTTRYVITRMCKTSGDPNLTSNSCAKPLDNSSSESPKKGEVKYGEDVRFSTPSGPFYRIVVRSIGPRNSVSFTETFVHF